MNKLTLRFERDDDGVWLASVPQIRGCHTYGRSLRQARARLREALALWVDDVSAVEIVEDIRLSQPARAAVRRCQAARLRVTRERAAAEEATAAAVRELVGARGLSVRDAGELLGLSHQRVAQLAETKRGR